MRTEPAQRPGAPSSDLASAVLLRAGPAAAFAALAVCVLATLLVPVGLWRPLVVVPLLLPVAVAIWWLTRLVPDRLPRPTPGPIPAWTAMASVAVAVAFGVWAGMTHGEHLILRRDAGSYALYAQWLATRHGLPVDGGLAAFGGPAALDVPGFTLASPAFFQVLSGPGDADVVPQFLLGAPAVYSLGWWLAGWDGLLTLPALIGSLGVLAAAGLAARLIGPRWAPVAAAALALTQPVLHAARATLSEPLAMLFVLAAACLAVDAVHQQGGPPGAEGTRRLALLAGGVLGLAGLVRIDALREVAVAVPVCAVLALRRHRAGLPLAGAAVGTATLALIPAALISKPYVDQVGPSLRPLGMLTGGLTVLSGLALWLARRRPAGLRPGGGLADRVLPGSVAAAVLVVGAVLASRPLWMAARQPPDDAVPLIESLQRQQGLPVDGGRTYAERSIEWLVWYTGPIVAAAALITLAVLAARAVRWWRSGETGRAPGWLVPAAVGFGSAVLTLLRPGITPDHPWADRRLVPVVLPLVVLAATGAAAWAVRTAGARPRGRNAVAVVAVLALLVPPATATWPLAGRRTEVGQPRAATQVCAALQPGDAVLAVEDAAGGVRAQNEWVQVVRGVCGVPSAALISRPADRPAALTRLGELVRGAGGRLVLLSAGEDDTRASGSLTELGLTPWRAARLQTTEDQRLLVRRPHAVEGLEFDVWLAVWSPPEGR